MTPKELSQRLNLCQYHKVISHEDKSEARDNRLVVAFGYSDDGLVLTGAEDEFIPAWEGQTVYFTKDGLLKNECNDDECPYFKIENAKAIPLSVIWHDDEYPCWTFSTDIPHETFDVMAEDELFCKGIVFSLDDVMERP